MHAIDTLFHDHLADRQAPPRKLIERHTRRITDEKLAHSIAGRLACALPSAEALDYLRRHLRAPLLTVAAGIGFWAYCLHQVQGIETLATDLYAPEDNPRFHRPGWYPVQPMDVLEALRRYPDHVSAPGFAVVRRHSIVMQGLGFVHPRRRNGPTLRC